MDVCRLCCKTTIPILFGLPTVPRNSSTFNLPGLSQGANPNPNEHVWVMCPMKSCSILDQCYAMTLTSHQHHESKLPRAPVGHLARTPGNQNGQDPAVLVLFKVYNHPGLT